MSYKKDVIPVYSSKEGYNAIAKEYHHSRNQLSSFDHNIWIRCLPRELRWLRILDLGAGDWRTFGTFRWTGYERYVAFDGAERLLKRHSGTNVEKVLGDFEEDLPFDDESFDIITMFFVVEHVQDMWHLLAEIRRILAPWGRLIISYFPKRRENKYKDGNQPFKIEVAHRKFADIEEAAEYEFFQIEEIPIRDWSSIVGKIYCLTQ